MSDTVICCSIICTTIIIICFIIGYYTNKETKETKIKNARDIVRNFEDIYNKYDEKTKTFSLENDRKSIEKLIIDLKNILYI